MTDYPFLVVERCHDCGQTCVGVMELVIGSPRPTGGLMRVPFEEVFTVLDACHHITDDEPETDGRAA